MSTAEAIRTGAVTARTGTRPGPAALVALARPWFWPVSLLPYYLGFVLAQRRLLPSPGELPAVLTGALVAGPAVWLAVLAVNDAHDVAGDRRNPRKAGAPVADGRISPAAARRIARVAAVVALLAAGTVGATFAAGTALVLVLGWAYSAPPVRLKARPGADVAANALAIGALGPLAGWCAVHPVTGFPWQIAVQGTLVGVALYVPTSLVDLPADRAAGYRTVAARLGATRAYRLGLAAWAAAAGWSVLLAATGQVMPHRMLAAEVVLVPVLLVAYHLLLRRRRSFIRIAVLSLLFLAPSGAFTLAYVGVW